MSLEHDSDILARLEELEQRLLLLAVGKLDDPAAPYFAHLARTFTTYADKQLAETVLVVLTDQLSGNKPSEPHIRRVRTQIPHWSALVTPVRSETELRSAFANAMQWHPGRADDFIAAAQAQGMAFSRFDVAEQ